MAKKGFFISLEGVDGAGKSTHLPYVESLIQESGWQTLKTREPGGTPLGEQLRKLVVHEAMSVKTEALLMYASRVELINQVIKPALEQGTVVISDRFEDSSFAYQASAGGLGEPVLQALSSWCLEGFQPDLTLLFDCPPDVSATRLAGRDLPQDKFDAQGNAFKFSVREGFLNRAKQNPSRVAVIDASGTELEVRVHIKSTLQTFIERWPR